MIIKTKAFTLLELIVVILIVGVLAAVGFPAYQSYVTNSRMAESYTVMDALGKKQITYYLENAEFYNLYQIMPMSLDSNMITSHPVWEGFGYAVPVNSSVIFNYRAWAGKTNVAGTELVNPGDSKSGQGFTPISSNSIVQARYSDGTSCNVALLSPTGAGIVLQRNYDWSIFIAVADLNHDRGIDCTAIVRVMEAGSDTQKKPSYVGGFLVFNQGK